MKGFVVGFVCGAGALYGAMLFHVVQAKDGFHFIRKSNPSLKDTYVDIREFGFSEWKDHTELAAALTAADRSDLLQNSAADAIQRSFDGFLKGDE